VQARRVRRVFGAIVDDCWIIRSMQLVMNLKSIHESHNTYKNVNLTTEIGRILTHNCAAILLTSGIELPIARKEQKICWSL
jgi:hypothetical protein